MSRYHLFWVCTRSVTWCGERTILITHPDHLLRPAVSLSVGVYKVGDPVGRTRPPLEGYVSVAGYLPTTKLWVWMCTRWVTGVVDAQPEQPLLYRAMLKVLIVVIMIMTRFQSGD